MINQLDDIYASNRMGRRKYIDPKDFYSKIEDFEETDEDGKTFLHLSVNNLDLEGSKYLLEKGLKPKADNSGNTLFHELANSSITYRNADKIIEMEDTIAQMVNLLLEIKVKPKRKNNSDKIAYIEAGEALNYPLLEALSSNGIKMDGLLSNQQNIIHHILSTSKAKRYSEDEKNCARKCIISLMSSGVDIDAKDAFGKTAEDYALRNNLQELLSSENIDVDPRKEFMALLEHKDFAKAKELLTQGVDINSSDEKGMTPLMFFCLYPNSEVVKFLIENGADLNYRDGENECTSVSYLITRGYYNLRGQDKKEIAKILEMLCDNDLELDAVVDKEGNTAINLLCAQPNLESINTKLGEVLIDADANLDLANLAGLTPIMSFSKHNGEEYTLNIAEMLLDEDIDLTHADKQGNTAVMYAAMHERDNEGAKILELILEADNSIASKTNNEGKTAMDLAIEKGNEACAKIIITNL